MSRMKQPRKFVPHRCTACGKVNHDTKKLAAAAAAAGRRSDGQEWTYYRCPSGSGQWHAGHEIGWRRQHGLPARQWPENQRASGAH